MNTQAKDKSYIYSEVLEFLYSEAALLDNGEFRKWLDLLAEDVVYRMPVRVTRERGAGRGFVGEMSHFEEDRHSLEQRIHRLETEYAWAEDPPSRTRHFVSNVRLSSGDQENETNVNSYLFLYRTRGDTASSDILSAERRDVLRQFDGQWKIAHRTIFMDQATLAMHNLSVFL